MERREYMVTIETNPSVGESKKRFKYVQFDYI
jgi:hypothetical protein